MPVQNDSNVHHYLKQIIRRIVNQIVNFLYIYLYLPLHSLFVFPTSQNRDEQLLTYLYDI